MKRFYYIISALMLCCGISYASNVGITVSGIDVIIPGSQGVNGERGPQGIQGPRGFTGMSGAKGDTGESYTPQGVVVFDSLSQAVADIGNYSRTLHITNSVTLTDNLTIPATLELIPENGAIITIPSGKTLTINSSSSRWPKTQIFNGAVAGLWEACPEWFGQNTIPGETNVTTPVQKALLAAPVLILSDKYYIPGNISMTGGKTIKGLFPTTYNRETETYTGAALIGGSIFSDGVGSNKFINIVIDVRGKRGTSTTGADAITVARNSLIDGCVVLGDDHVDTGAFGTNHGINLQISGNSRVNNTIVSGFYHGTAIRTSNNVVTNCKYYYCAGDSVIIKSVDYSATYTDTSLNYDNRHAEHNIIDNIYSYGDPNDTTSGGKRRAGPVFIMSFGNVSSASPVHVYTRYNSVSNVTTENAGPNGSLYLQSWLLYGETSHNTFSNIISKNGGYNTNSYDILLWGLNTFYNTLTNITVDTTTGRSFGAVNGAHDNVLIGGRSTSPGSGLDLVGTTWAYTQVNDVAGNSGYTNLNATTGAYTIKNCLLMSGSQHLDFIAHPSYNVLEAHWAGASDGSSLLHIRFTVMLYDGTNVIKKTFVTAVRRNGTSTLVSTNSSWGDDLLSSGALTFIINSDVSTPEYVRLLVQGSASGTVSYSAEVMTDSAGVNNWSVRNNLGLY